MILTTVIVYVKPEFLDDFIKATIENHKDSIKEQGNLRFDVLQSTEEPTRFLLYEVFESDKAVAEHKKTPHYLKWRKTVADWMAKPRQGIPYKAIYPEEKNKW